MQLAYRFLCRVLTLVLKSPLQLRRALLGVSLVRLSLRREEVSAEVAPRRGHVALERAEHKADDGLVHVANGLAVVLAPPVEGRGGIRLRLDVLLVRARRGLYLCTHPDLLAVCLLQ